MKLSHRGSMRPFLCVVLLACPGFVHSGLADQPPDAAALSPPPPLLRAGFEAIEDPDLRAMVGFLASPELEGRESGTRGYDIAARYCATLFERYGLKPAGDAGSFYQALELHRSEVDHAASGIDIEDPMGKDRLALGGNLAVRDASNVEWTQDWCFAGHGEGAAEDAPDDFAGLPVRERVVLILPRAGKNRYESRAALAAGATRVAIVADERVRRGEGLSPHEWPANGREPAASDPSQPLVVYISRAAADRILRSRNHSLEELLKTPGRLPRFLLDGVKVRLTLQRKRTVRRTSNVVGLLEGSDPALSSQVVGIGAHLDHVGVHNGKIYHGADDDASGTAGVLALARAFTAGPRRPARSLVFMLFTAEEKGLWGSRHFVERGPFPVDRFFAEFQMDMIGRNEEVKGKDKPEENTNSVHVVGAQKHSRDMHRAVLSANKLVGLDLEYDAEDLYHRSDHYSFGERGVPIAFFCTGFHPDYHQPTDTADRINYTKMARILRLVFAAAFEIADRPAAMRKLGRR